MKLPVTLDVVESVLREADAAKRLSHTGQWSDEDEAEYRNVDFCGCAAGNLLWEASGRAMSMPRIYDACEIATKGGRIADGDIGWIKAGGFTEERFADAGAEAKAGRHLNAISILFERHYEEHGIDRVTAEIRKALPRRFMLDIDGLRAMPTWKRKPAKQPTKRGGKGRK